MRQQNDGLGSGRTATRPRLRREIEIARKGPCGPPARCRCHHGPLDQQGRDSLLPSETKIAALVQGVSNLEIASRLFLSPRTVATHVSHILKKLDVHSRIDTPREATLRTIASR